MTVSAAERDRAPWRSQDPLLGWLSAIFVAALALFLRRWQLGNPHQFSFDETYYAKDAWSLIHNGYVLGYVEGADASILAGNPDGLWQDGPSMIVHPEVGKWLIGLGIKAFGMDPYGWRIASAVVGALLVLVMCRFVRRVTGSTLLGLFAGLLMCFDGLHFVLSRLALLDIFLAFFILCGAHCVVADRQWLRDRLEAGSSVTGWRILWRPWLLVGGVCFGLATGTKWSGLYALAVFGLLAWAWSAGARRTAGQPKAWLRSVFLDGLPAFASLVLVAFGVYVASWTGWLIHADAYEQAFSNTQYTAHDGGKQWPTATEPDASGLGEVTQSLRSLVSYHQDVYAFHSHFLNDATHDYSSNPRTWLLMTRPVGVAATLDIQPGDQGCAAPTGSTCLRVQTLLGNPLIWWAGSLSLIGSLVMWIGTRDWRHGLALVGLAGTWLPWFLFTDRPIFSFYAITALPFLILSLTLMVGHLIGPATEPNRRRPLGVVVAGTFLVATVISFAWFWPIWTNQLLTHDQWMDRMWFRKWI